MFRSVFLPLAVLSSLVAGPALSQDRSAGVLDSVVVGAFVHELMSSEEGGTDGNLEVRLRPLFGRDWRLEILPTVGGTVNFSGDTNTAYAGATFRFHLNRSFFVEGFFGLAVHDADTPRNADGLDLGCPVLFREGAGAGYRHGKHALSLYFSHASHGHVLCDADENDGMTGVGLRYAFHL